MSVETKNEKEYSKEFNHWILNKHFYELKDSFDFCISRIRDKKRLDFKEIIYNFFEVEKIFSRKKNKEEIYFAILYEYLLYSENSIKVNIIEQLENCIQKNVFDERLFNMKLCNEDGTPTLAGKNYFFIKYGNYEKDRSEKIFQKIAENYIKPKTIQDITNHSIIYLQEKNIIDVFYIENKYYGLITHKGQVLIKGNKRSKNKRLFIYPIEEYFSEQTEMCTHQ
ncbi:MAG: hypothetical protein NZZ41_07185 [Candidatus Dojkabacteria bacterium]|nr:hypothetical protein [Candidatus Dojkabacteria bacterium]